MSSGSPLGPPEEGNVNLGPGIVASILATTITCIIVVAARFYIRGYVIKAIGWDDWTILLALFGTIIGTGLDFVEVHYGFGRPDYYLSQHQLHEYRKYTYGEWIQTFITLTLTKISICLFLIRIPTAKSLIRPLQASIVVLVVSFLVLTFLWIFQCSPVSAAWSADTIPNSTCFSRGELERIIISQAVISAVSDFSFAAFPILLLWKVQMALRSKIALCCLMGLGVIVGACCIVRTVLNFQSIPLDTTYGGIDNWFWRLFEVQLGIIAACAPALRPGYKLLSGRFSSFVYSTTGRRSLLSSGKNQSKHVELADQERERRCRGNNPSISKVSYGGSMEMGGENAVLVALPRNAILKKTTVDVDPDSLRGAGGEGTFFDEDKSRGSLEDDVRTGFRKSVEIERNERLVFGSGIVW